MVKCEFRLVYMVRKRAVTGSFDVSNFFFFVFYILSFSRFIVTKHLFYLQLEENEVSNRDFFEILLITKGFSNVKGDQEGFSFYSDLSLSEVTLLTRSVLKYAIGEKKKLNLDSIFLLSARRKFSIDVKGITG